MAGDLAERSRIYDAANYRKLPTGWERRLPDGRTIQAHDLANPEWARALLERIDEQAQ